MDEDTAEFFPLDDDDEVDGRPLDMSDGWPEHIHSEVDPLDPDAPSGVITFLDEELSEDA